MTKHSIAILSKNRAGSTVYADLRQNLLIDLFIGSGFGVSSTIHIANAPRHVHDSSAIHFFELPPAFSTSIEPVIHIVPSMTRESEPRVEHDFWPKQTSNWYNVKMIEAVIILDNKLSHYTVWFAKWRRLIELQDSVAWTNGHCTENSRAKPTISLFFMR